MLAYIESCVIMCAGSPLSDISAIQHCHGLYCNIMTVLVEALAEEPTEEHASAQQEHNS